MGLYYWQGGIDIEDRSGYILVGWFFNPEGTGARIDSWTRVTNPNPHTVYAVWVRAEFEIELEDGTTQTMLGGEWGHIVTIGVGETFTIRPLFDLQVETHNVWNDWIVEVQLQNITWSVTGVHEGEGIAEFTWLIIIDDDRPIRIINNSILVIVTPNP